MRVSGSFSRINVKDWNRKIRPKTLDELFERVDRLATSLPDIVYRDSVTLVNSVTGNVVAHGGRSVPRRVLIELDNQSSGAMPEVSDKTDRTVTIYSYDDRVVNLTFLF